MILSHKLKRFIIKYSLISSLLVWAAGSHFKDFTSCIIHSLIHPFVSLDIDSNGEPDLKQIKKFTVTIKGIKFPIGRLIIGTVDFLLTMMLIFAILWVFLKYSFYIRI